MSKKIATLTFTDTPNYGALLQAYALQRYINDCGNQCVVINYQNKARRFSQVSGLKKLRSILWHYTFSKLLANRSRTKRTQRFRESLLNLTSRVYRDNESLKELNETMDGFIVGSDQVWNPKNNAGDPAYLLDFAGEGKLRVSYAASFGTDKVDEAYLKANAQRFKAFSRLSVRERSGKEQLEQALGIKAEVVADPVFLLSGEHWQELAREHAEYKAQAEYVLCYVLPGNREVEKRIYSAARDIAQRRHLRLVTIGKKPGSKGEAGEELIHDCGPLEFLSYIINANAVVTNSFHGTALSIINEKDFWCVMASGAAGARNTRLTNLLEKTGLSGRQLICGEARDPEDLLSRIDYSASAPLIEGMVHEAKSFLDAALDCPSGRSEA